MLQLILHNVRTPGEREGDLMSQIGSCRVGEARLQELIEKYGAPLIRRLSIELLDYSERLMRAELARVPSGTVTAEDFLDSDGFHDEPIRIRAAVTFDPSARTVVIDFAGSSPQVESSINAVYAITYSAVYYVFRCLLPEDAPATAGLMRPITVIAPSVPSSMPCYLLRSLAAMWKLRSASSMFSSAHSRKHSPAASPPQAPAL